MRMRRPYLRSSPRHRAANVVLATACALGLSACRSSIELPDLNGIYDSVAQHHDQHRNPVVVIPGVLGTRLLDGEEGAVVWGAFGGKAIDPSRPDGARTFALPMAEGRSLQDLQDHVVTDGVLETVQVRLAGLPIELRAYVEILTTLGAGGYRDPAFRGLAMDYGDDHFTCFQYPYDWRRDNVESAQRLYRFLREQQAYVAEQRRQRWGDERPVRFDVIAHSMGGLVLRYMLRYGDAELPADGSEPELTWAGAELVERAILVATPNAGSLDAIQQLIRGRKFGPFTPRYEAALVGTFPSLYQLLPRSRHGALVDDRGQKLDFMDPELWIERGWGLADPAQDRVLQLLLPEADAQSRQRIALDHLRKSLAKARQFHRALDRPAAPPAGTRMLLFAGDAEDTPAVLRPAASKARVEVQTHDAGDGTVLRSSALMDERRGQESVLSGLRSPITWSQVQFLFTDHLGVTSDPAFSDNVLYLLLESHNQTQADSLTRP